MNHNDYNTPHTLLQRVQCVASGRELEILQTVAGIDCELLDGRHHPCPKCGGRDRFRLIDTTTGGVFCNQCFREKNRDYIDAVKWMHEVSFQEALSLIAEYLGVNQGGKRNATGVAKRAIGYTMNATPKAEIRLTRTDKPKPELLRTIPFEYMSGAGDLHVLVERLEFADGSKSFRQSHWDTELGRYTIAN